MRLCVRSKGAFSGVARALDSVATVVESHAVPLYGTGRLQVHLDDCDSTQRILRSFFPALRAHGVVHEADGLLVTSTTQSLGAGRAGSLWSSPPGSLSASFLTVLPRTPTTGQNLAAVQHIVGMAVCEAGRKWHITPRIKWPNDIVVVDGGDVRKLGGIICEAEFGDDFVAVMAGLGLNVTNDTPGVDVATASVKDCVTGATPSVDAVRQAVLEAYDGLLPKTSFAGLTTELMKAYTGMWVHGGEEVTVEGQDGSGVIAGVTPAGELVVEGDEGVRVRVEPSGWSLDVQAGSVRVKK